MFVCLLQLLPVHSSFSAGYNADLRVGISIIGDHLELSFGDEYCLFDVVSGEFLPLNAGRYKILPVKSRIEICDLRGENRASVEGPLFLQPVELPFADSSFQLHNALYGLEYRGALEIIPEGKGLLAVNVLDLESYLLSVLPAEMPAFWGNDGGMEALKAQAIAARTFAHFNREARRHSGYHLCDQEHCQVYKGKGAENPCTDRAVRETSGKVLTYGGRIIEAFYHASNGGFTELSQNVWQKSSPYLASVPDPYDDPDNPLGLPGFMRCSPWKVTLSRQILSARLAEKGYNIGEVERIDIVSSFASGRVEEIALQGKSGKTLFLTKEDARVALGLESQLYSISGSTWGAQLCAVSAKSGAEKKENFSDLEGKWVVNGHNNQMKSVLHGSKFFVHGDKEKGSIPRTSSASLVFEGRGRGHGIGMSQYGAYNRSRAGHTCREILSFYYPGAEIVVR
ncbi:MAG: SpoIID/LytB domain-containing protein [Firmicutes bacterium]|nr:SpoIID/LytB domain-containing protein [Bacillota bacterium]